MNILGCPKWRFSPQNLSGLWMGIPFREKQPFYGYVLKIRGPESSLQMHHFRGRWVDLRGHPFPRIILYTWENSYINYMVLPLFQVLGVNVFSQRKGLNLVMGEMGGFVRCCSLGAPRIEAFLFSGNYFHDNDALVGVLPYVLGCFFTEGVSIKKIIFFTFFHSSDQIPSFLLRTVSDYFRFPFCSKNKKCTNF